jgi:L,D-peptidoglycan transpeptidase YkuD (ErfK/YbiS/YcfS/YnhG family)
VGASPAGDAPVSPARVPAAGGFLSARSCAAQEASLGGIAAALKKASFTFVAVALLALALVAAVPSVSSARSQVVIPRSARQLVVVSSPTVDPPGYIATLRVYVRSGPAAPWREAFGGWDAETGSGHLVPAALRREGDHATPIGVFGFGATIYGNARNPGGLHYRYHRLVCGDWWDEDSGTALYNHFVHVRCGTNPDFAYASEALWTETRAYPYFAVIRFNMSPIVRGARAPGSGIFLHSWMNAPTEGCVALRRGQLLRMLRWLRPAEHPVIEIRAGASV